MRLATGPTPATPLRPPPGCGLRGHDGGAGRLEGHPVAGGHDPDGGRGRPHGLGQPQPAPVVDDEQLLAAGAPRLAQPAVPDPHHAVRDAAGPPVVADQHERGAGGAHRGRERVVHEVRGGGVELAARLVGEHEHGPVREGRRDGDPLRLAAGQRDDLAAGEVPGADGVQGLSRGGARRAGGGARQPQLQGHVVEDVELGAQRAGGVLVDPPEPPDPPGGRGRGVTTAPGAAPGTRHADLAAGDDGPAGGERLLAGEDPQQGGLARAVGAVHDDALAGLDGQRDAAQRDHRGVGQGVQAERVLHVDDGPRRGIAGGHAATPARRRGSGSRSDAAARTAAAASATTRTPTASRVPAPSPAPATSGGARGRRRRGDGDQPRRERRQGRTRQDAGGHGRQGDRRGAPPQGGAQGRRWHAVRLPRVLGGGVVVALGGHQQDQRRGAGQQGGGGGPGQQVGGAPGHGVGAQRGLERRPALHGELVERRIGEPAQAGAGQPQLERLGGSGRRDVDDPGERRQVEHGERARDRREPGHDRDDACGDVDAVEREVELPVAGAGRRGRVDGDRHRRWRRPGPPALAEEIAAPCVSRYSTAALAPPPAALSPGPAQPRQGAATACPSTVTVPSTSRPVGSARSSEPSPMLCTRRVSSSVGSRTARATRVRPVAAPARPVERPQVRHQRRGAPAGRRLHPGLDVLLAAVGGPHGRGHGEGHPLAGRLDAQRPATGGQRHALRQRTHTQRPGDPGRVSAAGGVAPRRHRRERGGVEADELDGRALVAGDPARRRHAQHRPRGDPRQLGGEGQTGGAAS